MDRISIRCSSNSCMIDFTMDNGSHFTAEVRDNRDGSYTLINIDNQDE